MACGFSESRWRWRRWDGWPASDWRVPAPCPRRCSGMHDAAVRVRTCIDLRAGAFGCDVRVHAVLRALACGINAAGSSLMCVSTAAPRVHRAGFHATILVLSSRASGRWGGCVECHVYERYHPSSPSRASLALLCAAPRTRPLWRCGTLRAATRRRCKVNHTAAEAMGNLSCTCAGAITPLAATLSAGVTDEFKHAAAEVA